MSSIVWPDEDPTPLDNPEEPEPEPQECDSCGKKFDCYPDNWHGSHHHIPVCDRCVVLGWPWHHKEEEEYHDF